MAPLSFSASTFGWIDVRSLAMRMSMRRLATASPKKNHSSMMATIVRTTRQAMLVREKSTRRSNCTVV